MPPTKKDLEFKKRIMWLLHWTMGPKEFIDVGFSKYWDEIWDTIYEEEEEQ